MKPDAVSHALSGLTALFAMLAVPIHAENLEARPNGFNEVPTLSTPAKAKFRATINKDESEIQYELSYADFPTPVLQAHLHLGKRAINGGVMVFLCTNLGNGPAGTPLCPASPATVSGTLRAADVVAGAAAQGIAAGELAEVIRAIRSGAAYANVHSQAFPGAARFVTR